MTEKSLLTNLGGLLGSLGTLCGTLLGSLLLLSVRVVQATQGFLRIVLSTDGHGGSSNELDDGVVVLSITKEYSCVTSLLQPFLYFPRET